MSDGARGRATGILSNIWRSIFGDGRRTGAAAAAAEEDDSFWERREAGFTSDGTEAEVVVRSRQWDFGEGDVRDGIRHADDAFERNFRSPDVDAVDAPEEREQIDEGPGDDAGDAEG